MVPISSSARLLGWWCAARPPRADAKGIDHSGYQFCDNANMEKKRKVLALIRVSSEGQADDDKTGIQRQKNDIAIHCKTYNLEIVGEPYQLEGISGANVQHSPKFREILSKLSQPSIAGIVIAALDRFYRPE